MTRRPSGDVIEEVSRTHRTRRTRRTRRTPAPAALPTLPSPQPPSHRARTPSSDSRKAQAQTPWSQSQSPVLTPVAAHAALVCAALGSGAVEAPAAAHAVQARPSVHGRPSPPPSDSCAQASPRRARAESPLLHEGDAAASSGTPPGVPSASGWGKVRSLHIQRAPTLDRAGLTWHSDPGEWALKELLLGSRSLDSYTIAGEHVPL